MVESRLHLDLHKEESGDDGVRGVGGDQRIEGVHGGAHVGDHGGAHAGDHGGVHAGDHGGVHEGDLGGVHEGDRDDPLYRAVGCTLLSI